MTRNALSPVVELKANQNFLESDNFNEPAELTLSVRKPIHTWGALESKILAAEIDQEASRLAVEAVRMQVRRQAIENYFGAVMSVRMLDHLSAASDTLKQYEDLIRNRVQQQVSPMIDLELVVSRLARNEAKRIEISRQLEDARTQIRQLTGVSVDKFEVPSCRPDSQVVRDREVAIELARQHSSHLLRYLGVSRRLAVRDDDRDSARKTSAGYRGRASKRRVLLSTRVRRFCVFELSV